MITIEEIEKYEEKGYFFRGITGEFDPEETSKEDAAWFDDVIYSANEFCGDPGYDFIPENLTEYFESHGLAYKPLKDEQGIWFIAEGVNACERYNDVFQDNACPNAKKVVVFQGRSLGDNIAGDGTVAVLEKVIEVVEIDWD